jgi:hypothetical protein
MKSNISTSSGLRVVWSTAGSAGFAPGASMAGSADGRRSAPIDAAWKADEPGCKGIGPIDRYEASGEGAALTVMLMAGLPGVPVVHMLRAGIRPEGAACDVVHDLPK